MIHQEGGGIHCGKRIVEPDYLKTSEFDTIIIGSLIGIDEIPKQLEALGIHKEIDERYSRLSVDSRILFLSRFSEIVASEEIPGCVAEAGVYKGDFARYINFYFPDRKLYLFDTFEGFDERDFEHEKMQSFVSARHIINKNEDIVMEKMVAPDNVLIRKGYFPDTAVDLDEQFCFVNLDMDLYKPTLEGIKYFRTRMVKGGIILIHDYFSKAFPNIREAVYEYERISGEKLHKGPIGDDLSLAIFC